MAFAISLRVFRGCTLKTPFEGWRAVVTRALSHRLSGGRNVCIVKQSKRD